MNDLFYLQHFNPEPIPENYHDDEVALMQLASNGLSSLISEFSKLHSENLEDGIVYQLPKPVNQLPREKPLPKEKEMSKWQQFAQRKGILHRKKEKMVFDDQENKYMPRQWRSRGKEWMTDRQDGKFKDELKKERKEKVNQMQNEKMQRKQGQKKFGNKLQKK